MYVRTCHNSEWSCGLMQTSQNVCMPRSAFLEEATELLASNPFVRSQPTKTIHIHFRALETIHTYMVVTISSAAPRGWDGMHTRKQSGSTFTAAGWLNTGKLSGTMALRRRRSIHDGFPQERNLSMCCSACHTHIHMRIILYEPDDKRHPT